MTKAFSVSVEHERLWADGGATVRQRASRNWSGYVLTGGPYKDVTGTFQVPILYPTALCRDTYAEWVGVDGVGNQDLLQAGISEQLSTVWGVCTRHPQVWAWWESVPGPAAPLVTLAVRPGQWVTVTIAEVFRGWWFVGVFNDSTGKTISTQGLYDGPHSSAEWVVEASSSNLCSTGSQIDGFSECNMAAFAGSAHFTELDAVGPTRAMAEVDLVQHAVQVTDTSPVWSGRPDQGDGRGGPGAARRTGDGHKPGLERFATAGPGLRRGLFGAGPAGTPSRSGHRADH